MRVGSTAGQRLHTLSALRHRDFRLLWVGNFFFFGGEWVMLVTLGWLVLQSTNSPFMVGVVTFLSLGPTFFFSIFGGVVADRFQRRFIIAISRGLATLFSLVLALLATWGVIEVWHVFILAFLVGMTRAFDTPATQAMVPNLVKREELMNGVALLSAAMTGSRVLGPALAGPMITLLGVGASFFLSTAVHGLGAVSALFIRSSGGGGVAGGQSPWRNLSQGFAFTWHHSFILLLLALVSTHCLFPMSYDALLPAFARDVLGGDASVYGFLMMAAGGGAFLSTLVVASLGDFRRKGALLLVGGALGGVSLIVFSSSSVLSFSLVWLFIAGATNLMFMTLTNTLIQESVSDEFRGRVMSIFFTLTRGLMAIGALVFGALGSLLGVSTAMIGVGVFWIIFVLVVAASRPVLWRLGRRVEPIVAQ